ncbi:MAG: endonuclease/exonuclease/phosphatase family protein [Flavobacteriales bacterium]|nr:endonuclease/exonuclease/phosphatase family protein [Flavobacteriales bacterium]
MRKTHNPTVRTALFLLTWLILGSVSVFGQFRVMSYNILNYPTSELLGRADTLRNIVDHVQPDLFLIQELKSEWGLEQLLTVSFANFDNYLASEFVPQNNGGSNGLQQAIIYNSEIFTLHSQDEIYTSYRDVNEFVLYFNDEGVLNGDTTFLYVYVTHLKSSEGNENEQLRLEMVEAWREHVALNVPDNAYMLLGGDFNLYTYLEPAYQLILNAGGNHPMYDPLDAPGVWTDSGYPFKQYLTQSTRQNVIFNDGAGGGIDDRFDFVMLSEALMNTANDIHYAEDSYHPLGNNGTCFNQSIIDCDQGNEVPYDVLQSLYYMSDHLPVVLDMELNLNIIQQVPHLANATISMYYNPNQHALGLSGNKQPGKVELYNASGVLIASLPYDAYVSALALPHLPDGMYIARETTGGAFIRFVCAER